MLHLKASIPQTVNSLIALANAAVPTGQAFSKATLSFFLDTLIRRKLFFIIIEKNKFRGDLINVSSKKSFTKKAHTMNDSGFGLAVLSFTSP